MSSDSKDQPPKSMSSFRQEGSMTNQGGGQVAVKPVGTFSSSSTILLPTRSYDHGCTPLTQPRTINIVLFSETGVGKSSVINLIAQREVARISSDVDGCTMQSTRYEISFDNMNFAIFDTIGLDQPQMAINDHLKAVERAYELITKLSATGGIHFLLFCMRGGRITATTLSNYRLFCECLCSTQVPIALVFTGLERELEMEDWWTRNKAGIEYYGLKSDSHACITAVQGDTPDESFKYIQSQVRIRELLETCYLKNKAFSPEPLSWFAKVAHGMRLLAEAHQDVKKRDVISILTYRCKLDLETARKIAVMMEKCDEVARAERSIVIRERRLRIREELNLASGKVAKDAGELDALGDMEAVPSRNPEVRLETVEEDVGELDVQSRQQGEFKNVPHHRDNALKGQAVKKGSAWSCQGCAS